MSFELGFELCQTLTHPELSRLRIPQMNGNIPPMYTLDHVDNGDVSQRHIWHVRFHFLIVHNKLEVHEIIFEYILNFQGTQCVYHTK